MTKYNWRFEQIFYALLASFVTFLFCHLALTCYFSDSEIWLLTLSQNTFHKHELISIFYKWSFHAITYLFSHFAPTELSVYYYARTGWMLVAVVTQLLIAYTFTNFTDNKKFFLPLFISLMTFSAFFNQGFRVRGDILSVFAHTLILYFLLSIKTKKITSYHYLILFILNALLISSTPKSLFFYLAQFVFAVSLYKNAKSSKTFFLLIWTTHVLPVVLLLGLILLANAWGSSFHLLSVVHEVVDYYLKSFDDSLFNTTYLSVTDFAHVLKSLAKSPIHAVVFVIGVLIYLFKSFRSKNTAIFTAFNVYFGLLLIMVLFHNQKLPFFIGTFALPLVAHSTLLFLSSMRYFLKNYFALFCIALCGGMSFFCVHQYKENVIFNNNHAQALAITSLEKYQAQHPHLSIYDIIGLLPRKNNIFLFVGPSEVSRKNSIIEHIRHLDPDIILFVYKFIFLEPEIKDFLTANRIPIEPHVWVKGEYYSVTQNMNYFRTPKIINNKYYWIIPHSPQKYIFDFASKQSINKDVLYLDKNLVPTHPKHSTHFAIPKNYLSIVQTNTDPIGFLMPPYALFRFDTSF